MAIQNFLAGGFYGKLGNIVGQRWKNKRTIRTYVIPKDPKTPAQQANRARFGLAILLSQQAMNINKGNSSWKNPKLTEWAWRVRTAKTRIDKGLPVEECIPIYPDNFGHTKELFKITPDYSNYPAELILKDETTIINESRAFALTIYAKNEWTGSFEQYSKNVSITANQSILISIPFDNVHSFPAGSYIYGKTIDDLEHENESIFFLAIPILQPVKPTIEVIPTIEQFYFDPINLLEGYYYAKYSNIPQGMQYLQDTWKVAEWDDPNTPATYNGLAQKPSPESNITRILLEPGGFTWTSDSVISMNYLSQSTNEGYNTAKFNCQMPEIALPNPQELPAPNRVEIPAATAFWQSWPTALKIQDPGMTTTGTRQYRITIYSKNEWTGVNETTTQIITSDNIGTFSITIPFDNVHSYPIGSKIEGVTVDGAGFGDQTLFFNSILLEQPSKPTITITPEIESYYFTGTIDSYGTLIAKWKPFPKALASFELDWTLKDFETGGSEYLEKTITTWEDNLPNCSAVRFMPTKGKWYNGAKIKANGTFSSNTAPYNTANVSYNTATLALPNPATLVAMSYVQWTDPVANWEQWPEKIGINAPGKTGGATVPFVTNLIIKNEFTLGMEIINELYTVQPDASFAFSTDTPFGYSAPLGSMFSAVSWDGIATKGAQHEIIAVMLSQPSKPSYLLNYGVPQFYFNQISDRTGRLFIHLPDFPKSVNYYTLDFYGDLDYPNGDMETATKEYSASEDDMKWPYIDIAPNDYAWNASSTISGLDDIGYTEGANATVNWTITVNADVPDPLTIDPAPNRIEIENATPKWMFWPYSLKIEDKNTATQGQREFALSIHSKNEWTGVMETEIKYIMSNDVGYFSITIPFDNKHSYPAGSKIEGATIDSQSFDEPTLFFESINLTQPSKPTIELTPEIDSYYYTGILNSYGTLIAKWKPLPKALASFEANWDLTNFDTGTESYLEKTYTTWEDNLPNCSAVRFMPTKGKWYNGATIRANATFSSSTAPYNTADVHYQTPIINLPNPSTLAPMHVVEWTGPTPNYSQWPQKIGVNASSKEPNNNVSFITNLSIKNEITLLTQVIREQITVIAGNSFAYSGNIPFGFSMPAGSQFSAKSWDGIETKGTEHRILPVALQQPSKPSYLLNYDEVQCYFDQVTGREGTLYLHLPNFPKSINRYEIRWVVDVNYPNNDIDNTLQEYFALETSLEWPYIDFEVGSWGWFLNANYNDAGAIGYTEGANATVIWDIGFSGDIPDPLTLSPKPN